MLLVERKDHGDVMSKWLHGHFTIKTKRWVWGAYRVITEYISCQTLLTHSHLNSHFVHLLGLACYLFEDLKQSAFVDVTILKSCCTVLLIINWLLCSPPYKRVHYALCLSHLCPVPARYLIKESFIKLKIDRKLAHGARNSWTSFGSCDLVKVIKLHNT